MLKVSTPDGKLTRLVEASQRQEYIDKGWIIEDTSGVEMMLDEDGNTLWRYKEDTEWNTISGGSGSSSLLDPVIDVTALKAINTTTFTTVKEIQVANLGKFIFNSNSIQYPDDLFVIKPTNITDKGRWEIVNTIKGYSKVCKNYNFYPIDSGVSNSYSYKDGRLSLSLIGSYLNGILVEDTLKGQNKLINFKLPLGISGSIMTTHKANGSTAKLAGAKKGFSFLIGNTATLRAIDDGTATFYDIIPVKTSEDIIATESYEVTAKVFGNRISMTLCNLDRNKLYNCTYKDLASILSTTHLFNGFTANANSRNAISDITGRDLTAYKNLLFVGDSNTFGYSLKDRADNYSSQVGFKCIKNAIDINNAGISGDVATGVLSRVTTSIPTWLQANAYSAGDKVIYTDNKVYSANSTISAGTAWSAPGWTFCGEIGVALNTLVNTSSGMTNDVLIYIGINDIAYHAVTPANCYNTINSTITALKSAGYNKVYLATIPPLGTAQASYATTNPLVVQLNTLIKNSSTADGVVDIYALLTDTNTSLPYDWALHSDGLHLTRKANEYISDSIIELLKLYNV